MLPDTFGDEKTQQRSAAQTNGRSFGLGAEKLKSFSQSGVIYFAVIKIIEIYAFQNED
jgi:hypothetical protein